MFKDTCIMICDDEKKLNFILEKFCLPPCESPNTLHLITPVPQHNRSELLVSMYGRQLIINQTGRLMWGFEDEI